MHLHLSDTWEVRGTPTVEVMMPVEISQTPLSSFLSCKFISSYICSGQPGCMEAFRHYPVKQYFCWAGNLSWEVLGCHRNYHCWSSGSVLPPPLAFLLSFLYPHFFFIWKSKENQERAGEEGKMEGTSRCYSSSSRETSPCRFLGDAIRAGGRWCNY